MGLAPDVFYRRPARFIGALRPLSRKGIGGLAKNAPRKLVGIGTGHRFKMAPFSLSHGADDDDELCLTWHPGHVSDFFEGAARLFPPASRHDCSDLQYWRINGWNCFRIAFRSPGTTALDDLGFVTRHPVGSFMGVCARHLWAHPRCVLHAIYGARSMGNNSGAHY